MSNSKSATKKIIDKIKEQQKIIDKEEKSIRRNMIWNEVVENTVFIFFIIMGIIFWIFGYSTIGLVLVAFGLGMIAGYETGKYKH